MKFLMVGIDYFTKWMEAKPLTRVTEHKGFRQEEHYLSFWDS